MIAISSGFLNDMQLQKINDLKNLLVFLRQSSMFYLNGTR